MFKLDDDSKIKIQKNEDKIKITIKINKDSDKYIYLSFDIDEGTADKIISELVSIRAKM
tara:strand:- start:956 stop:1132 length:177 start_codon:yes stop_codon:yes gene_type:complete